MKHILILSSVMIALIIGGVYIYEDMQQDALKQARKEVSQTNVCKGPATASCIWDYSLLPSGTNEDDYYVDIEIRDTQTQEVLFGTVEPFSKKSFSTRLSAEPGLRYACIITLKLKDNRGKSFCGQNPVYYSEPVGLCSSQ